MIEICQINSFGCPCGLRNLSRQKQKDGSRPAQVLELGAGEEPYHHDHGSKWCRYELTSQKQNAM